MGAQGLCLATSSNVHKPNEYFDGHDRELSDDDTGIVSPVQPTQSTLPTKVVCPSKHLWRWCCVCHISACNIHSSSHDVLLHSYTVCIYSR